MYEIRKGKKKLRSTYFSVSDMSKRKIGYKLKSDETVRLNIQKYQNTGTVRDSPNSTAIETFKSAHQIQTQCSHVEKYSVSTLKNSLKEFQL